MQRRMLQPTFTIDAKAEEQERFAAVTSAAGDPARHRGERP
jgi:hypothetical protein